MKRISGIVNLYKEDIGIDTVIRGIYKLPEPKPFIMASSSAGEVSASVH